MCFPTSARPLMRLLSRILRALPQMSNYESHFSTVETGPDVYLFAEVGRINAAHGIAS